MYRRHEPPQIEFPDQSAIDPQPLPEFARVQYGLTSEALADPVGEAQAELDALDVDELNEGATVVVGIGSRGIHRIIDIVRAIATESDEHSLGLLFMKEVKQ